MSLHLDELPQGPSIPRPATQRAGHDGKVSTDTLVEYVLAGDGLHDALRDLAARGWTEGQLFELIDRSAARTERPADYNKRRGDIPRLVKSAANKAAKRAGEVFGSPLTAPAAAPATAPTALPTRKPTRPFALTPIDVGALPRRSWLTYGLLLDGSVTVASAIGGIGKSAWGLRVALAVASGQSWGAWEVNQRRRVLVINAEDGPDEL
ncbi:MAG: AAA family ATPase, partial [Hyphomicrobium sp.]